MICNINLSLKDARAVHITEVMKNLKKEGHDVILFAPDTGRFSQYMPEIKYIPFLNIPFLRTITLNLYLCIYMLIYSLRFRPDIIYARRSLLPTAVIISKILRLPCIAEVNSIVSETKKMEEASRLRIFIYHLNEWLNNKFADKIIAVTGGIKKELHEKYKVPSDKIVVIPNGANIDLFKPMYKEKAKEELNLDKNIHYVCFVGNFSPWQGVEYLIQSAPLVLKKIPETEFLLVGYGRMNEKLSNLVEKTGVSDKFIFTGAVPYKKIPKYINASDVLVSPKKSLKSGHSPLKLYEYMSCGKPVVASKLDGFEILEENNAGILVEPGNLEELAKAIIKLIKDEKLGREMGGNGREYVVKYHSWRGVAKRITEVCNGVIG